MSELRLDGEIVLFDEVDAPVINAFRWRVHRQADRMYVRAWQRGRVLYLHRVITLAQAGEDVDHANGNGLDNRRVNLRRCTRALNQANRGKQRGTYTSRFKGVHWDRARGRWQAQIAKPEGNGRRALGRFATEGEAARAYDAAALAQWGEFAQLNFPREDAA